jgi:predicted O-linked N-acetylglucosamine transferase (SPINDLY family)
MSRNSVGALTHVGLADLVADTPDAYRRAAIGLADDGTRLARLRATLRATMAASPLMDAAAFARSFEAACRQMRDNVVPATRE